MITKHYLISNATNDLWYTDDSIVLMHDRWTPNIAEAFKFPSYEAALNELDIANFPLTEFKITEIIVKGVG